MVNEKKSSYKTKRNIKKLRHRKHVKLVGWYSADRGGRGGAECHPWADRETRPRYKHIKAGDYFKSGTQVTPVSMMIDDQKGWFYQRGKASQ